MKRYTSVKDTVLFSVLAILMIVGISIDLILFGNGIILSMVTAIIPFIIFTSGLMYCLMRLNIMEFTTGSYYDTVNREMNVRLAERKAQKVLRRSYRLHAKRAALQRSHYSDRRYAC